MSLEIAQRMREAIYTLQPSKTFAWLEEKSGIKQTSWSSAFAGRQRVTIDMLQFVFKEWPSLTSWIATGTCEQQETPMRLKIQSMKFDLKAILIKEPAEWSVEEVEYVNKQYNIVPWDSESIDAIKLGMAARESHMSLNECVKNKQHEYQKTSKSNKWFDSIELEKHTFEQGLLVIQAWRNGDT
jgi:hypothetical protein